MVWLLAEILSRQSGAGSEVDTDLIKQAIYGGHLWALDWKFTSVLHSHTDDLKKLKFVTDVLDMWNFIEAAFEAFSDEELAQIKEQVSFASGIPTFTGFDGNNEAEYMGIAMFLINDMGRFQRFSGRDLNSHTIRVSRYSRMLQEFRPMKEKLVGRGLSVDEILILLDR